MKFSIINSIDVKSMSEADRKIWEAIDAALGKAFDSAIGDEKNSIKDTIVEELKKMDEFKPADVSELINKTAFTEAIEEVKKSIPETVDKTIFESTVKELKDSIVEMKAENEKKKTVNSPVKSIAEQIAEQFKGYIDDKGRVDVKKACQEEKGNKKTIEIELDTKAPNVPVMSGGVATTVYGNFIDPVLSVDPRFLTVIRKYSNVANITDRSLTYAEWVPEDGDAEWVPEGGLKPSMSGTLVEKHVVVAKVALTTKVSEETLTDLPILVAELQSEIISRIGLKEEEGLLTGSGNNGEIKGVLTNTDAKIPGFVMTGLEVATPNHYDALVAGYTQIVSVSNMAYRPNLILMNPIDYANMQLTKDLNGQYLRPFRVGDELIQGLRVETSTAIALDTFFMGDFTRLNIRDRIALNITFGWENDDFTKNLVTIIGEKRLMTYVKSQYRNAFVHDTFSNVITAITA